MEIGYRHEFISIPIDGLGGEAHQKVTLTFPLDATDRKVGGKLLRKKRLRKKLLSYLKAVGKSKTFDAQLLECKLVDDGNETKWSVSFEINRPDSDAPY